MCSSIIRIWAIQFQMQVDYLFHYTDSNGLKEILKTRKLLSSSENRKESNFHYGPGVYFTTIPPSKNAKKKIWRNNYVYSRCHNESKVDCYLRFSGIELFNRYGNQLEHIKRTKEGKKIKRKIWKVPTDIPIDEFQVYYGKTDDGLQGQKQLFLDYFQAKEDEEHYGRCGEDSVEEEEEEEAEDYLVLIMLVVFRLFFFFFFYYFVLVVFPFFLFFLFFYYLVLVEEEEEEEGQLKKKNS